MKQSADERPVPSLQRKAAIASGQAVDHAGSVEVRPIANFDLAHTIFNTLEGAIPRFVMKTRIAKKSTWHAGSAAKINEAYDTARERYALPAIDPALMSFLLEECDFDVEHADGSFLDHLYFCFEYAVPHYPEHSPVVLFLHSILGTGTNTFAMNTGTPSRLNGKDHSERCTKGRV